LIKIFSKQLNEKAKINSWAGNERKENIMNGDITKIYTQCNHCGEMIYSNSKSGFCNYCSSPEKREKQVNKNKEIKKENISKGYHYANH
jgi:Zn finger protein HypA/HybF involved in hydrogenase expression